MRFQSLFYFIHRININSLPRRCIRVKFHRFSQCKHHWLIRISFLICNLIRIYIFTRRSLYILSKPVAKPVIKLLFRIFLQKIQGFLPDHRIKVAEADLYIVLPPFLLRILRFQLLCVPVRNSRILHGLQILFHRNCSARLSNRNMFSGFHITFQNVIHPQ